MWLKGLTPKCTDCCYSKTIQDAIHAATPALYPIDHCPGYQNISQLRRTSQSYIFFERRTIAIGRSHPIQGFATVSTKTVLELPSCCLSCDVLSIPMRSMLGSRWIECYRWLLRETPSPFRIEIGDYPSVRGRIVLACGFVDRFRLCFAD